MKQFLLIVGAIIVAVMIMRGIMGCTGQPLDPNSAQEQPQYQVVPCSTHPNAIGC
jgi:hypothetical protein